MECTIRFVEKVNTWDGIKKVNKWGRVRTTKKIPNLYDVDFGWGEWLFKKPQQIPSIDSILRVYKIFKKIDEKAYDNKFNYEKKLRERLDEYDTSILNMWDKYLNTGDFIVGFYFIVTYLGYDIERNSLAEWDNYILNTILFTFFGQKLVKCSYSYSSNAP